MSPTGQDLLKRWIDRQDAQAFRIISERHAAMVYSTCRRILGDASAAEDMAQECFQRLAFKLTEPKKYLAAWLHRVATNVSLSHIRTERRRRQLEARVAPKREKTEEVEWHDIQEHIDQTLAELPDDLRQVIVLHFFENQTHSAIATRTGASRSAVTYRIRKGIELIRRGLKRRGVSVVPATLTSLMASHLKAQAAPATLVTAVAKLALLGRGKASAPTALTGGGVLGGAASLKMAAMGALLLMTALGAWWYVSQANNGSGCALHPATDNLPCLAQ